MSYCIAVSYCIVSLVLNNKTLTLNVVNEGEFVGCTKLWHLVIFSCKFLYFQTLEKIRITTKSQELAVAYCCDICVKHKWQLLYCHGQVEVDIEVVIFTKIWCKLFSPRQVEFVWSEPEHSPHIHWGWGTSGGWEPRLGPGSTWALLHLHPPRLLLRHPPRLSGWVQPAEPYLS